MIYNPSRKASTISNYSLRLDWQQRWFIKLIKTDVLFFCSENNQPGEHEDTLHPERGQVDAPNAFLPLIFVGVTLWRRRRRGAPPGPSWTVGPAVPPWLLSGAGWVMALGFYSCMYGFCIVLVSALSANVPLNHLILMKKQGAGGLGNGGGAAADWADEQLGGWNPQFTRISMQECAIKKY